MPDLGQLLASALGGLVVVVLVAFALGTGENVRRGNAILRWLQAGGLPVLGPRTTLRWLGSSAVELRIVDPAEPFREVTVTVVLEPRDLPWLWAISRRRGRRDLVILRADLRRAPQLELHLAEPGGWTSGETVRLLGDPAERWQPLPWPATGAAGWRGRGDPTLLRPVLDRLAAATGPLSRLSISQTVPHLELHLRPPNPDRVPAERVTRPFRDLARLVVERT
jgi:hypothetical protein